MNIFRHFVVFLLVFGMLPWGAYANTTFGVVGDQPASYEMSRSDEAAIHIEPSAQTKLSSTNRCRTATLPGMTCNPDRCILPLLSEVSQEPSSDCHFGLTQWNFGEFFPSPPKGPPRFF